MPLRLLIYILAALLAFSVPSCGPDEPEPEPADHGRIIFSFLHHAEGNPLQIDTMIYTNLAGNHFMITEVQYFISDVTLHNRDGSSFIIDDWTDIHYIDNDIPSTMNWEVFDEIPPGSYDSITFMFGISQEKNISLMFVNPPERDMFWPEVLGGGYHYMKLNGKWSNEGMAQNRPFEFHLGIGQIYSGDTIDTEDIIGYVHNNFTVNLPGSSFQVAAGDTLSISIIMNIEEWFAHPNTIDFETFPDMIMQCQECMRQGCENGKEGVFRIDLDRE